MGDLTKNFNWSEVSVSASRPDLVKPVPDAFRPNVERLFGKIIQPLREKWGRPFKVLSCYRPPALNTAIGGSPTSQHVSAAAADITTADVRALFYELLRDKTKYPCGQVIYYPSQSFVHIALPSRRYPLPSFFVAKGKTYIPVTDAASAAKAIG